MNRNKKQKSAIPVSALFDLKSMSQSIERNDYTSISFTHVKITIKEIGLKSVKIL